MVYFIAGANGLRRIRTVGLSLRPWGTQRFRFPCRRPDRFIPTPVGNTAIRAMYRRSPTVHPHARGEHSRPHCHAAPRFGSSPRPCREHIGPPQCGQRTTGSTPRPWGTPGAGTDVLLDERFIPTPVGNTGRYVDGSTEKPGSSPRPWGTPNRRPSHDRPIRFIPTPVGNTR